MRDIGKACNGIGGAASHGPAGLCDVPSAPSALLPMLM